MKFSNNQEAFISLVRAGLWNQITELKRFGCLDYAYILQLAEEQSVVGLVTAGLELVQDVKVPQEVLLQFIGRTLQIEQRNKEMNEYLAKLVGKMRTIGIYTILVKGQGIAQCYERPLWRTAGDIDFLLSDTNFWQAKKYFDSETGLPVNVSMKDKRLHLEYSINSYVIELHGTLHTDLYRCIDKGVDEAQSDAFFGGSVRSWLNGQTVIFLPSPDNDVIFVFTHVLQHYSQGGIGLRQICDLCRLLHTYKHEIDKKRLNKRLERMRLKKVWQVFGTLMVEYLGLPPEEFPLFNHKDSYKTKASKIMSFILKVGNMGHNRDTSYSQKYPFLVSKTISFFKESSDLMEQFFIFPEYAVRVWFRMVKNGVESVINR